MICLCQIIGMDDMHQSCIVSRDYLQGTGETLSKSDKLSDLIITISVYHGLDYFEKQTDLSKGGEIERRRRCIIPGHCHWFWGMPKAISF